MPVIKPRLAHRPWLPDSTQQVIDTVLNELATVDSADRVVSMVEALTVANDRIHNHDSLNLNPATNTLNPRAEALLGAGLGSRPSLGYPGAKYEMGLEAIEQIEVITAALAAQVFRADHVELRAASGAMANLYAFMACAQPGDPIIVPPASVGGHVTHNSAGAAGWYGLDIHCAPIDPERYTIDVAKLGQMAAEVQPKLITVGMSLNLTHHDVAGIRQVADSCGARVLFDAAHLSGPIAGGVWPNPLDEGAHLMSFSAYKSLGGPAAGMVVTNDAELAQRIETIAFPGLTANFDIAKTAALGVTLADWIEHGPAYGAAMIETASALAGALADRGLPVYRTDNGYTQSHAFALEAASFGGGHKLALHLREANLLTSSIGLPSGDDAGLRLGTNELVRWGATADHMEQVADLFSRAANSVDPGQIAPEVSELRRQLATLSFVI